ncbi:DNA repair protein RadA/Sms [Streptomyces sp. 2224.1]|uniref:DNA repair protein RadA n=1 Tax=unclassified Streptomyces TaxID=2593676 RepID=UPI00088126FA|nr:MULTISPECIES: DNA repair protein RadA [unclassified Streptomyces]PBC84146.1 DNA repair protein RadA/Sms [Streptomyces sp. 2321.6]SDR34497.1 DNA repair protein RadA/Sms [Streptomyces sp. KS_16]SEB81085.1 DNA repair protein RadA/Sms [Streptomyces sp. 2224.1]SED21360.1 DNA repair protein RadA/Sms [Streptomyces sp. 2133.1]SEE60245.1 DNA repair protein RadA/Sms [Streptomyces sp. 2112.3]
MATRKSSGKERPSYRCTECGWTTAKWLGRCPECQAWGTVEEFGGAPAVRTTAPGRVTTAALPIGQIDGTQATARSTGVPELDRVLGGGLVPGAVVLLAGEPGVGKSTLLLDAAAKSASDAHRTLYVTGEESASQVRLRADRIGALDDHLYLAAETDLSAVLGHLDTVKPSLLILDSVQTVASPEIEGAPGGMAQVREVAGALIRASKERGMSTLLVGHVTKDGAIAGPRLLEHLVDVVLHFEGDRHARLRLVRGVKNRYGTTDEVGCFELHDEGITGLADPSGLFLTRRAEPVPGTCLTVTLEGRRPLVAEVQALTVDSQIPSPRRTTSGLETSRVSMMLAVLEQRGRISALGKRDIYSATVGGVKLTEPAADLAVALALASAASDTPLPKNLVAIGEVGLAGEVRRVTGVQRRLSEAARLGFTHALVPSDPGKIPDGMRVLEVADVGAALSVLPKRVRREAPQEEGARR